MHFLFTRKKSLSILQNILEFMEWFYKQILVKKSMLVFFSFFFPVFSEGSMLMIVKEWDQMIRT